MIVPEKKDRKIALVVVDLQNKFIMNNEEITRSKDLHIDTIKSVISEFRKVKRPVIFVTFDGFAHGTDFNTPEGDSIIDDVTLEPDDILVGKYHMNSFRNSTLADVIKSRGCDSILLMGSVSQYCVSATYWGASDHDLTSFMMKDGLISTDEEQNELIFKLYKTFTMDDVRENLSTTKVERPKSDDCSSGSH